MVVVLATKVYVYRFSDLKLLDQIDTQPNPRGLVALCPHPKHNVLACPGVTRGHARVELYDARKSTVVAAHESDLARLALSGDGSLLATASDKGTLIRVFDAHSGAQLREFRRGVDRALVYSIVFCPETKCGRGVRLSRRSVERRGDGVVVARRRCEPVVVARRRREPSRGRGSRRPVYSQVPGLFLGQGHGARLQPEERGWQGGGAERVVEPTGALRRGPRVANCVEINQSIGCTR